MVTQAASHQTGDISLRPRIVDVTDKDYATASSIVDADDTAYFERKSGDINLAIQ